MLAIVRDFYKEMLCIDDEEVRKNAFINIPYFYKEFRNDIDFKLVFESVLNNDEEQIEILQVLASCIHHLFQIADEADAEDEKPIIRRMFDLFLVSGDELVLRVIAENIKLIMPYMKTFIRDDESAPDQSPASVSSENFSSASKGMNGFKSKIHRKHSDIPSDKSNESLSEEEIIENSYHALLPKLLTFNNNLARYTFWREHVLFLKTLTEFIPCFNVPKLME